MPVTLAAIQGIRGSYSEEATLRMLGEDTGILECGDFAETFQAVASRQAEFAVVPIRNKIVGEIEATRTLMRTNWIRIIDEVSLPVRHVLVGTNDATFEALQTVRSQLEALDQCRSFFSAQRQLVPLLGGDTALSVKRIVAEGDARNGAIGSRRAAVLYGAKILREGIADDRENWTTFYLLGKQT